MMRRFLILAAVCVALSARAAVVVDPLNGHAVSPIAPSLTPIAPLAVSQIPQVQTAQLFQGGLDVHSFTLENGLQVVVSPDHASPVVGVSITYKVGSQNEEPGLSGFAHLFEHLMAQGTKSLKPREIGPMVESNGGIRNASTQRTITNYHSLVPRGLLDLLLWAESERMSTLNVDARALALEKQVVLEERRMNYENKPYRMAVSGGMAETVFSKFANRHATIGERADVENAKLEDVHAFYNAHYAPNNAVIALAGDVTVEQARALIEKHFGKLPPKAVPPPPDLSEPPLEGERRRVIADPMAKTPRLMLGWRAPERAHEDFWPLMLLNKILSGQERNPLYQRLVQNDKTAVSASADFPWYSSPETMHNPELFGLHIAPAKGAASDALLAAADAVIKRFIDHGPTQDELTQAQSSLEVERLSSLENPMDRAKFLSAMAAHIGSPSRIAADLARAAAVTVEDVRRAAAKWLTSARGVLEVAPGTPVPPKETAAPAAPAADPRGPGDPRPDVTPTRPSAAPQVRHFELSNGLKVAFVHDARLPLLEARLSLKAGRAAEAPKQAGLSQAAADLLFSDAALSADLARLGYMVDASALSESLHIEATGLARNAGSFFALLGQTLAGAAPSKEQVALWKTRAKRSLEDRKANPDFLTGERLKAELYAKHPLGRPAPGEADIDKISARKIATFRRGHMGPEGAVLTLAGDLDPAAAQAMLEEALAAWQGAARRRKLPALPKLKPARTSFVDRPGSAQADMTMAKTIHINPGHPDYPALLVANQVLGGSSSARLFVNLRVDKGWTYGSYSRLEARARGLLWTAEAQVRNPKAAAALEEMRREIIRLRDTRASDAEVEAAKRYLAGVFLIKLSSLGTLADYIAKLKKDGRDPAAAVREYVARIEAVTPEQVQAASRKYLRPDLMVTVVVGDKTKLPELAARP